MILSWGKRFQEVFVVITGSLPHLRYYIPIELRYLNLHLLTFRQISHAESRVLFVKGGYIHDMIDVIAVCELISEALHCSRE